MHFLFHMKHTHIKEINRAGLLAVIFCHKWVSQDWAAMRQTEAAASGE